MVEFVSVSYSERYRDLIDAADSIVDMKKCSELVSLYSVSYSVAIATLILWNNDCSLTEKKMNDILA